LRCVESMTGHPYNSEKRDERVHSLLGSLFHQPMTALPFNSIALACLLGMENRQMARRSSGLLSRNEDLRIDDYCA